TDYSFSVSAQDATGNTAANNPIVVTAKTIADTQAPTDFTATVGIVTSNNVELLLNATDNSGAVTYTIRYGTTTVDVAGKSAEQTSYKVSGLTAATAYSFSITAKDAVGNTASNSPIVLDATTKAGALGNDCFGKATESAEGDAFAQGYKFSFVSQGSDVLVTFELLDTKVGLVAFLFDRTNGFAETQMTNTAGNVFTTTLSNKTAGSVLTLACKFAYAGGLAVTRDFSYTVGNNCESSPSMAVTATSLTLLATNAASKTFDILSNVSWTVESDQPWLSLDKASGSNNATVTLSATANPNTTARNAQILVKSAGLTTQTIAVTQIAAVPTSECSGAAVESQDGQAFTLGYKYEFATSGNNVTVQFELLDAKDGLVAYLFNKTSGFAEIAMTHVAGSKFEATLQNQTLGATITVACKFAYANGLSVTKDLTYTVGKDCSVAKTLTLALTAINLEATADTKSFDITSDTDWSITSDQTWLTIDKSTGSHNDKITVSAPENPSSASRVATVTVAGTGVSAKTITVTQSGKIATATEIAAAAIKLYPNPVVSELQIDGLEPHTQLSIFDLNGKCLHRTEANSTSTSINVSALTKGVYYIRVSKPNSIAFAKFIKE
ncbi:MAG: hypothetical protein RIS47_1583, partial [Bacteroidota bacterium]